MLTESRVGLLISELDDARTDPQTLARLSLQGMAEQIPVDDADYPTIHSRYIARFPSAALLFGFGWRFRAMANHPQICALCGGFCPGVQSNPRCNETSLKELIVRG